MMACEGWEQIKNKKHIETFKQHAVSSALAIRLAFCGKKMELVHEDISVFN